MTPHSRSTQSEHSQGRTLSLHSLLSLRQSVQSVQSEQSARTPRARPPLRPGGDCLPIWQNRAGLFGARLSTVTS
ncbi:MAG: hypothetical protein JWO98_2345 [Frankiales bacterium]|nr:hypothetical protein [Frankiales bacterium]